MSDSRKMYVALWRGPTGFSCKRRMLREWAGAYVYIPYHCRGGALTSYNRHGGASGPRPRSSI